MHRVFPACRHADGTISSSTVVDVRRMASEDSEQFCSGFLAIHRFYRLDDPNEPVRGQMLSGVDPFETPRELLEVLVLRRVQRVRLKERNDLGNQIRPPAHDVAKQVLPVVVVAPVGDYLSHTEEVAELM